MRTRAIAVGVLAVGVLATAPLAGSASAQPGSASAPPAVDVETCYFGSPSELRAQRRSEDAEAGAPAQRGFFGGAAVGRGSIEIACAICSNVEPIREGLSYSGHLGWMVLPPLAVVLEHWSVSYDDRGTEWFDDSAEHLIAQRMTTVGAQLWLGSRLWVRGSVGAGKHVSDSRYAKPWLYEDRVQARALSGGTDADEPTSAWTPAVTGAIGFEWARSRHLALDIQLRAGATRRPADEYQVYDTAIAFGATWY